MSADGWRTCPRCLNAARAEYEYAIEKVKEKYGLVSREEYEALFHQVALMPRPMGIPFELGGRNFCTFRENEESYFKDGRLHFSYSGWCTECKYSVKWQTSTEVPEA